MPVVRFSIHNFSVSSIFITKDASHTQVSAFQGFAVRFLAPSANIRLVFSLRVPSFSDPLAMIQRSKPYRVATTFHLSRSLRDKPPRNSVG